LNFCKRKLCHQRRSRKFKGKNLREQKKEVTFGTMIENENGIILFDGVCNFCNTSINAIIRLDKKKYFRFAAIQSETGKHLMNKFGLDPVKFDSVILVDDNKAYVFSSAVLNIARKLKSIYQLAYVGILIPRFIRDPLYKWIAKNRYKWFGKKDACMIPSPELRSRFLL
jgi:predicted DCC family thiol-disulfide oxidoreductase YuxK